MKVKTILVSQPEPSSDKSPYSKLLDKHKLTLHFRPFIHVEGLDAKEVRQQKIDFNNFQNIVLTSRNAVDHFFRLCKEMRFTVPDSTKYFCQSEAVAFYLQKYVVYRKRKIYVGEKKIASIGLRISKGRTYHGISLNVDMDLTPFALINPCGYEGLEVNQISDFDSNVTLEDVKSVAIKEMQILFS